MSSPPATPRSAGDAVPASALRDDRHTGWRRVPPAYSPLPFRAIAGATGAMLRRRDPRAALREHLERTYDARRVALLDSGTHALELALRVAARTAGGGEEVPIALPAYSCFDVATAAVATGQPLMLYDLDPDTLAPDLDSLRAALWSGAGVVLVAPLWGMGVPWDAIHDAATRSGAIVVEDAAQGHGSFWRGQIAGLHARLSVLSFGRGKGWTGGTGGAVLAGRSAADVFDQEVAALGAARNSAATLARAAAMSAFVHPPAFGVAAALPWLHLGETRYHEPTPPLAISRASAALLLRSLDAATREGEARQAAAAEYMTELADVADVKPIHSGPGSLSGYLRFPVRAPWSMEGFEEPGRARALGIAPGYPATLGQLLPVLRRLTSSPKAHHWPGAEALVRELVTLPTHSLASRRDRRAIVALFRGYRRPAESSRVE